MAIYHNKYWSRRDVNGPASLPFVGSMFSLINPLNPPMFVINEWTQKYGRFFGYQHGWKNVLVVSDPELVQEVLVGKFDCFAERRVSTFFYYAFNLRFL